MTIPGVKSRRHSAMVVYNRNLLGVGVNQYKTDPFQAKFGRNKESIFVHAEINAIKNALRKVDRLARPGSLEGCSLYVMRLDLDDNRAMSMPCVGCRKAIVEFGIRKVYFTDETGNIEKIKG